MVLPVDAAGDHGVGKPRIARVRDSWLGGEHHDEADQAFANYIAMCAPHLPYLVRAQRDLLGRMVRYLAGQGVRQFLDLGSGLPTVRHVHEVAQDLAPASRVVYVDTDPGVVEDGRELLAGNELVALVDADIREPRQVLDAPEARRLLDLSEPLAVLIIDMLQHIPDAENPAGMLAAYRDLTCSGSYLGLSHFGPDEQLSAGFGLFDQMHLGQRPEVSLRDKDAVAVLFSGFEMVEPGIVPIKLWRPDPDDDLGRNPEKVPMYVGLGRKP
jgi:hypothetical protein